MVNDKKTRRDSNKSENAFRTISEVATELDLPQHVLRFWESKFNQIKPMKRGGGRRYYRPEDLVVLRRIRKLLYEDGYTIKGVQKLIKERGVSAALEPGSTSESGKKPRSLRVNEDKMEEIRNILKDLEDIRSLI